MSAFSQSVSANEIPLCRRKRSSSPTTGTVLADQLILSNVVGVVKLPFEASLSQHMDVANLRPQIFSVTYDPCEDLEVGLKPGCLQRA